MVESLREAQKNGVVLGLKEATNEVRQRLDIDVLLKEEPDTFNLFLLALAEIQTDYSSKTGYNELAGIHGLPSTFWDNVKVDAWDTFGGYCAHGLLIFPTWHRPYLSLFEQTIYLKMLDKANQFDEPHKSSYLTAVGKFRLPYFDYFRPRDTNAEYPGITRPGGTTKSQYDFRMPDIFNVTKVMVRVAPHNKLVAKDNPLYTFKWDKDHGIAKAMSDRKDLGLNPKTFSREQTVRYSSKPGATEHDVAKLNSALNSGREGRTELMLDIAHDEPYSRFTAIASDRMNKPGDITRGPSGSLEGSIHGNYHNLIGGNAHMSHPSVAAFDPVFWFHHWLFAVWQVIHPKSWFPNPEPGEKPESEAKLFPFRISKDSPSEDFFNSNQSRTTEHFGYTYPDIDGFKDGTQVWERFLENYLWSIRVPKSTGLQDPPAAMAPLDLNKAQVFQYHSSEADTGTSITSNISAMAGSVTTSARMMTQQQVPHNGAQQPIATPASNETVAPSFDREWFVDLVVQRHALNGPFTLYFFLGPRSDFTDDPNNYLVNPLLAGSSHIFVAPTAICDNCGDQAAAAQLASDTVPITPLLLDYMASNETAADRLDSLRPEHVKPFLEKYLRWRVVSVSAPNPFFPPYSSPQIGNLFTCVIHDTDAVWLMQSNDEKKDPRRIAGLELSVSARVSHANAPPTYEIHQDVIARIIQNAGA